MAEDNNRLICRYICDDLDFHQKAALEYRMAEDSRLREEAEFLDDIRKAVSDEDVMMFREKIHHVFSKRSKKKKGFLCLEGAGISMMAGIAFMAALLTLVYMTSRQPAGEEIFNCYYECYPAMAQERSAGGAPVSGLERALMHYRDQEWGQAGQFLKKRLIQDSGDGMAHFYLAMVYLETGHEGQALEHFNRTIELDHPLFREQAHWYASLALIRAGEYARAGKHLTAIVQQQMWQDEKARDILRKID